jgi:hypothetical protein
MDTNGLKMKNCDVILGGDIWTVEFVRKKDLARDTLGECCWGKRRIRVRKDLCAATILDTLIHEMRHAQHPVMFEAESFIDRTSTELAKGLIKTGIVNV